VTHGRHGKAIGDHQSRSNDGSYTAWPHACARSENFKQRSIPAKALLLEFVGQYNGNKQRRPVLCIQAHEGTWLKSRTTI